MAEDISKLDESKSLAPNSARYLTSQQEHGMQPDDKVKFLAEYQATGNFSGAAKSLGRHAALVRYHLDTDENFALDFKAVKDSMKHSLEQTMYQNGLKEKGYMDRITWLRKNYPSEYNPNFEGSGKNDAVDAIKQLSQKLSEYEIVPKKYVQDAEVIKEEPNSGI